MILRAPKFWFRNKDERNIPSFLLIPFSKLWEFLTERRILSGSWEKAPVPVLCVGNIVIGGSGKTPVTQALQRLLIDMGFKPHVVSRGYKGKLKGPIYVSDHHTFSDVGDEPILLSKNGPVLIAKSRKLGIYKAWENGADFVLLDDGFQNTSVAKDLSLVVVDSKILFGNERIIPSGPLRESISSGLSRADAIVLVDHDKRITSKEPEFKFPANLPIIKAVIKPDTKLAAWVGQKVIAFSGIAHPEKFLATLSSLGCDIISTYDFSDHYPYKPYQIEKLKNFAKSLKAKLVTTEKDFVRIPSSHKVNIDSLPVKIEFENKKELQNLIHQILLKKNGSGNFISN